MIFLFVGNTPTSDGYPHHSSKNKGNKSKMF